MHYAEIISFTIHLKQKLTCHTVLVNYHNEQNHNLFSYTYLHMLLMILKNDNLIQVKYLFSILGTMQQILMT